jgi:ATP-dependent HslUV protease ATP-binding subunit HslU
MVKQEMEEAVKADAAKRAEEDLLDLLVPEPTTKKKKKTMEKDEDKPVITPMGSFSINGKDGVGSLMGTAIQIGVPLFKKPNGDEAAEAEKADPAADPAETAKTNSTREKFRQMLRDGKLEDKTVELVVSQNQSFPTFEFMGGGMEEMGDVLSGVVSNALGGNRRKKVFTVKHAREVLEEEEADKLIDQDRVTDEAKRRVEQMGIVFIDEIDKIATKGEHGGADVSREGVQRDILPIVEGATVNTKWGQVNTDHILFVAAGAFNVSKPSDLIPELQGRFPLRVELDSLGKEDFLRILTEPKNALTKQYTELLKTENIEIEFTPDAIETLAALAADVNSRLENIGARRLHTIMETLLADLSFDAPDIAPSKVEITVDYVNEKLHDVVKDQDLGRYIL